MPPASPAALLRNVPRRLAVPVQRRARARWEATGLDITDTIAATSALVVAPHADDETLGCGVTILRKTEAGSRVSVLVVSDGAFSLPHEAADTGALVQKRAAEARAACSLLGVDPADVSFAGLPDGQLTLHRARVRAAIADAVRRTAPAQVLVPVSCDGHPDHDVVSDLAREVVAEVAGIELLEYPVWLWTHWPFTRPSTAGSGRLRRLADLPARVREPRPLLVRTGGYLERKRAALKTYASQVEDYDGEIALDAAFLRHFFNEHEVLLPGGALRHLGGVS